MALVVGLYPAQLSGFTECVIYWLGIPHDYKGNEAVDTWPGSPLVLLHTALSLSCQCGTTC